MLPVLLEWELWGRTLRITGYGLFAILGATVGILLCVRAARRLGLPGFDAFAASILSVAAGLLGAKILFLAVSLPQLLKAGGREAFWAHAGLVWYGGVIGGAAAAVSYLKAYGLSARTFADAAVPGLAVGHALGRLGCVMAGCCYGKPTSMPWGLRYPAAQFFQGPVGVALHPVQLYEATLELGLGLLAVRLLGRWARGSLMAGWLVAYGASRLAMESLWRGDDRGAGLWGLSPSAALSLVAMALGAGGFWACRRFDNAQGVKLNPIVSSGAIAMTKADIIENLYEKVGFSKKESADIVELIFDTIKETLERGEKIKISGFGNFIVRDKKSRIGRNPQTGKVIEITARRVLTFRPSQVLKNALNGSVDGPGDAPSEGNP